MDTQSNDYGQQNFTLPHDVVPLPSQGIFYKNRKKAIKVGYLTAADENIIMAGGSDLTLNLLRAKIYEPDMRVEDLIEGDVEAILIFLRNTAFGPKYKISSIDPETGKKFFTEIMLDELDFRKPSQDPNEDGSFTIKLPKSNATVKVKPLTFKEIGEINKLADQYPTGRVAPKVTWKLQKQIISVEGDSEQGTINRFVEGLPIMDSKFIRNFINENEPQLDLRKVVMTPSGEKVDVEIAFGVEFFRVFF